MALRQRRIGGDGEDTPNVSRMEDWRFEKAFCEAASD